MFSSSALSDDNKEPIVIGMSAAFSGQSKNLGNDLLSGIMTYLYHVNKSGGVDGRNVIIKKYDDGYNPIPALRNTLRLMKEDNVLLLFSYVGTPTVTRVLPLLKLNSSDNFYLFFPFTGAQPQREAPYNDFVFNLRPSYRDETAGLVDNFIKIGKKKIAVFYQADAYGRSGWDGVRRALKKHGLNLSAEATYRRGAQYSESYKAQVDILKQAAPDAVIAVGSYAACAGFIRDARNSGWNVPVANLSFVGSESLLELLIEQGKTGGKDYTVNLINSEVVPNYNDMSVPAVREYRKLSQIYNKSSSNTNSHDLSFVGLEGFLNAKLLIHILSVMDGNVERKYLKEKTESIKNFDIGLPDEISLSPDKHQALDTVYYNTVKDSMWIPADNWEFLK
ncbi:MAG: ABC transporter substrate-binding protein [Candidatus Dadabacteria bacterium]|nr:ABC transporter substrate-binding protein [Candidatus Dadabacteria bacterium]NIS08563.1 ABC transporter substrate-binding protein [Candidatus Dadabacteria bacterium]NIV41391.1 ABC transporter substrate-binding protein [Candidatus Dadabacteria bacterium]NIX14598.1 ABC transporter substrate-binding protein [Candidatus Dadabacteria bacterium]NIY21053.1 ABC transporter substrate-binding protein [Candidatus Dadabacteria bacterium]